MNPRSLTPLWRIPRLSRRSTACANIAWLSANATWCTQPGSVGVRVASTGRYSLVKIVISRPSPGSKYRWLSSALSRFGCSKMKGIPSTPSQKSIDVCRSAPTIVMWWTPWLWSLRCIESRRYQRGSLARMPAQGPCPACGAQLVQVERSGVRIDACRQCRGVFLDRGELDEILKRERSYVSSTHDDDEEFFREMSGKPEKQKSYGFDAQTAG